MKYLFLDIDGVLTTAKSRFQGTGTDFSKTSVAAIERLFDVFEPEVIIHSTWRKLPEAPPPPWVFPVPKGWWFWNIEWFKEHCKNQGAHKLASKIAGEAPFSLSTDRYAEISRWITDNGKEGDTYVVLDDEIHFSKFKNAFPRFQYDDVLVIETNDLDGLKEEDVDFIIKWWDDKNKL